MKFCSGSECHCIYRAINCPDDTPCLYFGPCGKNTDGTCANLGECIAKANTTDMIGSTMSTVDLGVAQSGGGAFFDASPATPGMNELMPVTDISFTLGTPRRAVLYRLQSNAAVGIAVEVNQTAAGTPAGSLATVSTSTPFLRTFTFDRTTYVLVLKK